MPIDSNATSFSSLQIDPLNNTNRNIVKLDVGGHKYYAYRSTLVASPYFQDRLLFESSMPDLTPAIDNNGPLFVDRNGHLFEYILQYLRNGQLLVGNNVNLEDLKLEARFYRLDDFVKMIDDKIKTPKIIKKRVEYELMDVSELSSSHINKSNADGGGEEVIVKATSEPCKVIKVIDTRQSFVGCLQHDKYDFPESCDHPTGNRRIADHSAPKFLVRRTI